MKYIIRHIFIALLLLSITGCSDEPGNNVKYYQNIVTFKDNENGFIVMTYRAIDDSPLVTLRAEGQINTSQVAPGTRLVCSYTLPAGTAYGTDATIKVASLSMAKRATLEEAESAADIPYTDNGIYVQTLFRTGEYINLTCQQEVNQTRHFYITLDKSTTNDPEPTVYLTTATEKEQPAANGLYVASFDFTPLWSLPGVKGVKIVVNNTNNKYLKEFTFTKPSNL